MRLLLLGSPLGELDADSAVTGLMALHMADGEFPALFWGSPYGGTIESLAGAALFQVLPPSTTVITVVPMLFSAASAVLVWRIGRRLVGERAARLAAAFFWTWPFVFVWYSGRMGPYQSSLTFTLLAMLLLLRVAQNRGARAWELAAAGAAVGAAWWANPQTMVALAPAGLFLLPRLSRHRFRLVWVVLGAAAGAAPWLWHSATHEWATLELPKPMPGQGYAERLAGFFTHAAPQALGLRTPFEHDWLFGSVGIGMYVAVLAAFVVFALRDRRVRLLAAVVLAYPFLYAVSTYTWYVGQPRYLLFLMPVVCLLLGRAADGPARGWFVIAAVGVLSVASLVTFPANPLPSADGARIPDTKPVHALLRELGVTHAFADYWIAYRLTFETEERVIVTPHYLVRYQPYLDEVRAAPRPPYIVIDGSDGYKRLTEVLGKQSLRYTLHRRGGWAVIVPRTTVLPEEIAEVWA